MQADLNTLVVFARYLDALQKQHGLSQVELGRIAGCSQAAAGKWLKGKTPPGSLELLRLARYFGLSMDALFTGEPEPAASIAKLDYADIRRRADLPAAPSRIPPEALQLAKQAAEVVIALNDELKKLA